MISGQLFYSGEFSAKSAHNRFDAAQGRRSLRHAGTPETYRLYTCQTGRTQVD